MQYGEKKNIKHKLQQWFIENPSISEFQFSNKNNKIIRAKSCSGARIRSCNVLIKLLTCILYCIRVVNDERSYPDDFPFSEEEAGKQDVTL